MATTAHKHSRPLASGASLGRYDLIRQVAVGGTAQLFLARTKGIEGFEQLVVVKRILPQFLDNAAFVKIFLHEARLAAQLHHPNIAQVYDVGVEEGDHYISMEYVHGEDLGRIIAAAAENGVPLSLDAALTLTAGLCAGLHHAHDKADANGQPLGMVHRDASPPNVLVSYDGAVKLVDFGIARATTTTTTGGLKGKLAFMSPEQCRGQPLDRRSDLYAVGTILYELTTGQLPFAGQSASSLLDCIVHADVPPPSTLVADYPEALETIVMRALARDPAQRFSSARELQRALEDFADASRLRVSPLVLARLMSTLFPARLEEWERARAAGAFFVEQHVVRTLIESGKTGDLSPLAAATALAEAPEPEEQRDPTAVTQPLDLGVTSEIAVVGADEHPVKTSVYSTVAARSHGVDLEDALIAPPLPAPYVPPLARRLPTPPAGTVNAHRRAASGGSPRTALDDETDVTGALDDEADVTGAHAVSAAELAVGDSTELVRPLDHRIPARRGPRTRLGLLVGIGIGAGVIALGIGAAVATGGDRAPVLLRESVVAPHAPEPRSEPTAEPIRDPVRVAPPMPPATMAAGPSAPPPPSVDPVPAAVVPPPLPVAAPAHPSPRPVAAPVRPHLRPDARVHLPKPNDGKGSAWSEDSPFMPVRSTR